MKKKVTKFFLIVFIFTSLSPSFTQDDLKAKAEAYLREGETLSEPIVWMDEGKTFKMFFYLKNDEITGAIIFENGEMVLDEAKYRESVEIALLISDKNLKESLIELRKIIKKFKSRMERIEEYQIEIRNFLYDESIIYFSKAKFGFFEEDQELYLQEFLNDPEMFPTVTELGRELVFDHSEILEKKLQKFELINENLIWKNMDIIFGRDEPKKVDFIIKNRNQITESLNELEDMIEIAVEEDAKKECFSGWIDLIFIKSLSDKRTGNWRGCMAVIENILVNAMMSKMKDDYELGENIRMYYYSNYSLDNLSKDKKKLLELVKVDVKSVEISLDKVDIDKEKTHLLAKTLTQDLFSTRVPPIIEIKIEPPMEEVGEIFIVILKLKNMGETPALNLEIIGKLSTLETYITKGFIEVGNEETFTLEYKTKDLELGLNLLEVEVKYEGIYGEFRERSEIEVEIQKQELRKEADSLFDQGMKAFENKDYESAKSSFEQAKQKYVEIGDNEKIAQCDEWLQKIEEEMKAGIEFWAMLIGFVLVIKILRRR